MLLDKVYVGGGGGGGGGGELHTCTLDSSFKLGKLYCYCVGKY